MYACGASCVFLHRYPEYEIVGDESISKTASLDERYSDQSLNGIITDIHFLSLCDYLVCTFSSQVSVNCYIWKEKKKKANRGKLRWKIIFDLDRFQGVSNGLRDYEHRVSRRIDTVRFFGRSVLLWRPGSSAAGSCAVSSGRRAKRDRSGSRRRDRGGR